MIARGIPVDGWFLLDLVIVAGFAAWRRISGYRDGWHKGRRALLREQERAIREKTSLSVTSSPPDLSGSFRIRVGPEHPDARLISQFFDQEAEA